MTSNYKNPEKRKEYLRQYWKKWYSDPIIHMIYNAKRKEANRLKKIARKGVVK